MTSIMKRAAGIAAAAALMTTAGPVALAGASTVPVVTPAAVTAPINSAYQAGLAAAIGGWNAGATAAAGGFSAGATALGLPFQFTTSAWGPFGVQVAGMAPLTAMP
jgi:hypothetical protein